MGCRRRGRGRVFIFNNEWRPRPPHRLSAHSESCLRAVSIMRVRIDDWLQTTLQLLIKYLIGSANIFETHAVRDNIRQIKILYAFSLCTDPLMAIS
jgi:hypothetical protein